MMNIWIYPGSFDPVTIGHLDIIQRAHRLCDRLIVAVGHNPAKNGTFTLQERMEMLRGACAEMPNVEIAFYEGLLTDYVKQTGANAVVRSLRGEADYPSEQILADMNRSMNAEAETVCLFSEPALRSISSSVVREIASFGGDVSAYIPASAAVFVRQKYGIPERMDG